MAIKFRKAIPSPDQLDLLEQPTQLLSRPVHSAGLPEAFTSAKQQTGIEWTNATWNPMVGCSIHTAGCTNCYAMAQAAKINSKHYEGVVRWVGKQPNMKTVWTGVINQSPPHILDKPRKIKEPSMIFVNSMSDFFHQDMVFKYQLDAMKVMEETPRHVYQILTKRPEEIQKFLAQYGKPFPRNVWVGATMEREDYRARIDAIRVLPAHVRFLSIEPLVGPAGTLDLTDIEWVIIGGESGPDSRPMKAEWVRDVIKQCKEQHVPVFFKQWGIPENNPLYQIGGRPLINKEDPVGKGGSLVDGIAYKEFPETFIF